MKTNHKKLITQAVQGEIQNPIKKDYVIDAHGKPRLLPKGGSINYNVHLGFPVFGIEGDQIQPGVSVYNKEKRANTAFKGLSCIGNKARVMDGKAEGAQGVVVGLQSAEDDTSHVIIDFSEEDMGKMKIGDPIMIKSRGQGLALDDYPQVKIFNIDPDVFGRLGIREEGGKLIVPVRYSIPHHLNGTASSFGDISDSEIHISSTLEEEVEKYKLEDMRIGDLVFLENLDSCYAVTYGKKAGSVGIVVHGSGTAPTMGPGIVIIMSSKEAVLAGEISDHANLSNLL